MGLVTVSKVKVARRIILVHMIRQKLRFLKINSITSFFADYLLLTVPTQWGTKVATTLIIKNGDGTESQ